MMAAVFQPLPFAVPSEPTRCLRMGFAAKLVFLLFLLAGCATSQTHHVYLVEQFVSPTLVSSRIAKNERIAETWPEAKLTGKILDVKGEAIPNTIVHITNDDTGKKHATQTQIDGSYSIELPPGRYSLLTVYIGYARLFIEDIDLTKGEWRRLDAEMIPYYSGGVVPVVSGRKLSDEELRSLIVANDSLLQKYYLDNYQIVVSQVKKRDVFLYLDPSIDKYLKVIRL